MPEKKKKRGAVKKDQTVDIHQLVGRVHRLKILIGKGANPDTIARYREECDAKEKVLNELSETHEGLINKELAALDYVPK